MWFIVVSYSLESVIMLEFFAELWDSIRAIPCAFNYHDPVKFGTCNHYFCSRCVRDLREIKVDGHSEFIVED